MAKVESGNRQGDGRRKDGSFPLVESRSLQGAGHIRAVDIRAGTGFKERKSSGDVLAPIAVGEVSPSFWQIPSNLDTASIVAGKDLPDGLPPATELLSDNGKTHLVYLADTSDKGQVVVKLGRSSSTVAHTMYDREALLHERASEVTPHVPRFFRSGAVLLDTNPDTGKEFFPLIVMEYMPGQNFERANRRPLDNQETVTQLTPVAQALDSMAQEGIVHRDVNTLNLLERGDGTFVIHDFGIATTSGTRTQIPLGGVMQYRSPELVKIGEEVTPKSDVWMLGAVAYRARTGETFMNWMGLPDLPTLLYRGTYGEYLQEQLKHPNLLPSEREVFAQALAREPQARPSAGELIQRLAQAA